MVIFQMTFTPMYKASATFTVTAGSESSYTYSEKTADQISLTFPYILKSRYFRNVLLEHMGRDSVNGTLSAATVEDSNVVTMTMESSNAEDALEFLQAAIEIYPETAHFVLGNIQFYMIEEPSLPTTPYNQISQKRQIVYGGGGGLLLGLLICLILALRSKTVRSSGELYEYTNIKCLAYLPLVKEKAGTRGSRKNILVDNARIARPYRESLQTLSMRIQRDMEKNGLRTLMVTGSREGEGSTVTAVNLAISLADMGLKVLLVDADLRNAGKKNCASQLLGADSPDSISRICAGQLKEDEHLFTATGRKGLLLLANHTPADQPVAMLAGSRFRKAVQTAGKVCDMVIIDTPACTLYQDAQLVAEIADGILYVIQYDGTSLNSIRHGLNLLQGGNARMMGYAFNFCPENMGDYGYGRYGYSYGRYGYGYKRYAYDEEKDAR